MSQKAKGWLVHAGHYSDKSLAKDMVRRQREALEENDVPFDFIDVYEASARISEILQGNRQIPKWVLFRNSDMGMRQTLELLGTQCVNSFNTASICRDKFMTAAFCAKNGIAHPKTMKVPAVRNISHNKEKLLDNIEDAFAYPMIVKDETGEEGEGVILVHNREELKNAIPDKTPSCIIQEFIDTSWGCDARIFVVGGDIPLAVKRTNPSGDFRSNTAQGGSMEIYELSDNERVIAQRIGECLPDSSISVDIMWDKEGNPIVCELNGNPNFGSFKKRIFHKAPIASSIASMIADIDKR